MIRKETHGGNAQGERRVTPQQRRLLKVTANLQVGEREKHIAPEQRF